MFAAVMSFVPMAQARQAVTSRWRDFFELRLIARLIAQRPGRYLGLAAAITVLSMPVIFLQALPLAFPGWIDGYADLSRAQAMQSVAGVELRKDQLQDLENCISFVDCKGPEHHHQLPLAGVLNLLLPHP